MDASSRKTTPSREVALENLIVLAEMGREEEVRAGIALLHPADIAELMDALEEPEVKSKVFSFLDPEVAPQVLSLLSPLALKEIVQDLPEPYLQQILEALDSDDAVDLLGSLPKERVQNLLERLPEPLSARMEQLLRYPADTAGGLMQTEYVAVPEGITVGEAIERVRSQAREAPDFHSIFVVDHHRHLVGVLPLHSLILAHPEEKIDTLMNRQVLSVPVDRDQEEVAQLFKKYDLLSLPVTDSRGVLLGRITVDDVVDVLEEEASEDFYKLSGLGQEEPALDTPLRAIRRRLPWLGLNLFTTTLSASVIALFEGTIREVAIAAALMTIVAAQGGNAGIQTLTIVVRGLALGEIGFVHARRVLLKELLVALGNGMVLGLVAALVAYFWKGEPLLGLVLGLALVMNLLIAAFVGSTIPLTLRWLGIDPAVASNVFITACTDICGFLSFLGFLTLFLHYLR